MPAPGQSPRQALRAADGDVVVVGSAGLDAVALAAPIVEGRADAVFSPRAAGVLGALGAGAAPFALRRAVVADLDVTTGWDELGHEVAAQAAALGLTVDEQAGPPSIDNASAARVLATRLRWSKPLVARRGRLARRRNPKQWDESDAELAETLDNLDAATNYAEWIVALMAPYLSGRILEVGAGHGTFTELLARFGPVTATELSERAVAVLEERFAGSERITVRRAADRHDEPFDSAVLVNVLEHIDDDVGALSALRDELRPGGRVLVYAPAFNALYSRFDAAVGHYRRYTRGTLERTMEDAGLEVVDARYVNAPGALAWYIVATRLGGRPTEGWLTRLYDRAAVPVVRVVERRVRPPFGQSLLVAGERRE